MRSFALLWLLSTGCLNDQSLTTLEPAVPSFSVETPVRASWNATGRTWLTGYAPHVQKLYINGDEYPIKHADFSIPIELNRGINFLEIEAMAGGGHWFYERRAVIAGEFAPAEGIMKDSAQIRINQAGLDDISEIMAELVDIQEVSTGITDMNPMVELEYSMGTTISVDLQTIHFNTPLIELIATNDKLEVEVVLPNLFIDTKADLSVLWVDSEQRLEIVADSAVVEAELLMSLNEGVVEVETTNTEVRLEGFSYDVSLLPGQIVEDNLFNDTIRDQLETELAAEIGAQLPEIITELQSELETNIEFDLMGTQVGMDTQIANLSIDNDGVSMGLDLSVEAEGHLNTLEGGGYLHSGTDTPTPDRISDSALVISDDAINRAFYELWASGMFSQSLSTENGTLSNDVAAAIGASNCTIVTNPGLPPVLVEVDGATQLQVGEMDIDIMTPGFEPGNYIKLRVAANVNVEIQFDAGFIRHDLNAMNMNIDVVETNWNTDKESLIALMNALITPELLLGAVEDIEIEIPSIPGIEIDGATIHRESTGLHTGLLLNISADG